MISWLNNPWVIGIGGGILSGLVVTILSRYLLSRRENREYLQKVAAANQEIIYAVRPGISEGVFPTRQVLAALSAATARKHAVEKKHLFSAPELAQELMKEVMDSSFLSASDKQGYCGKLAEIEKPEPSTETRMVVSDEVVEGSVRSEIAQYRERMTSLMSMTMGVVAATTTAFMAFYFAQERDLAIASEKFTLFVPALLALGGVAAGTTIMFLQKQIRGRHAERRVEPEKEDVKRRSSGEHPVAQSGRRGNLSPAPHTTRHAGPHRAVHRG